MQKCLTLVHQLCLTWETIESWQCSSPCYINPRSRLNLSYHALRLPPVFWLLSVSVYSLSITTTCHQSKTLTGTPTSVSKEAWNYNLSALKSSGGRVMELFWEGMIWLLLFILSSDWSEEAGLIPQLKWVSGVPEVTFLSKVWYPQVRLPVWVSTARVSICSYWRSCFWCTD